MKVLIIGAGGREHALAWKIRMSRQVEELFCVPGNSGIAEIADCPPIAAAEGRALVDFCDRHSIDLTVVGPEAPLVGGLADRFASRGLAIFGPCAAAARLEGSKVFAKEFMTRRGIPTAAWEAFDDPDEALRHLEARGAPVVVKADGLAAGKGVFVCDERAEAEEAVRRIMVERAFGEAGARVLIEDRLVGREASFFAVADGKRIVPLVTCQDYKRVHDGDRGPNTGGMGAFSPAIHLDRGMANQVLERIVAPTITGMAREGNPYSGMLYVGLMLTDDGPQVLEYNCRFGDPETQVLLPRMSSDLVPLLAAAAHGDLTGVKLEWRREAAVTVVLAAEGYPGPVEKGRRITGLEDFTGRDDLMVFHAATKSGPGGEVRTNGGRVLAVTALGSDIADARERAYQAAMRIKFPGMHWRTDIATEAVEALRRR
jgi:phosphoribosylamine--glycine ligase